MDTTNQLLNDIEIKQNEVIIRKRGRPRGTVKTDDNKPIEIKFQRKRGRPIGTIKALVQPQQAFNVRDGDNKTYTSYSRYITKSGQTTYHKHTYTVKLKKTEERVKAKQKKIMDSRNKKNISQIRKKIYGIKELTDEQHKAINDILGNL